MTITQKQYRKLLKLQEKAEILHEKMFDISFEINEIINPNGDDSLIDTCCDMTFMAEENPVDKTLKTLKISVEEPEVKLTN